MSGSRLRRTAILAACLIAAGICAVVTVSLIAQPTLVIGGAGDRLDVAVPHGTDGVAAMRAMDGRIATELTRRVRADDAFPRTAPDPQVSVALISPVAPDDPELPYLSLTPRRYGVRVVLWRLPPRWVEVRVPSTDTPLAETARTADLVVRRHLLELLLEDR